MIMALEKWHPLQEIDTMRSVMDRMWEEIFPTPRRALFHSPWRRLASEEDTTTPAVDVIDRSDEVLVRLEMPGVKRDDIDVSVHENTLTVKGEVKKETEQKDEDYCHRERTCRSYARSINLPSKVNEEKIRGFLKDGVLNIHLPKAEEVRPRKIKVETAG
jgi:HSP20 family protein